MNKLIDRCIEDNKCNEYISISKDEMNFDTWIKNKETMPVMILAEGFEERSLGILRKLIILNRKLPAIILGRYNTNHEINIKYQQEIESISKKLTSNFIITENNNDGIWIKESLKDINASEVILDITGISNRGMFGSLDSIIDSDVKLYIAYSEAKEYWPKKNDWLMLEKKLSIHESLAEIVDKKPWLFGFDNKVEYINNYEGFDSAGMGRALIGFLPFKCARLASILGEEEYSDFIFIAGKPRLKKNIWRLNALKKINEPIIKNWDVVDISTFSYRKQIKEISDIIFRDDSLLKKYDVHLAILGSKLQTISCWVIARIVRSMTVITSVPMRYYPEAFSEGIGKSWIIELIPPN